MKTCLTNAFFFFISHSRPLIFRYRKRRYQLTNRGVEPKLGYSASLQNDERGGGGDCVLATTVSAQNEE